MEADLRRLKKPAPGRPLKWKSARNQAHLHSAQMLITRTLNRKKLKCNFISCSADYAREPRNYPTNIHLKFHTTDGRRTESRTFSARSPPPP